VRVKILRTIANATGNHQAGAIVDMPDEAAAVRIAAGHAAPVDQPPPPPAEDDDPATDPKPVDKMTVDELRTYAAEHDIDLGDAKKKADILAVIELAQDED
jgi:hypothetical protein